MCKPRAAVFIFCVVFTVVSLVSAQGSDGPPPKKLWQTLSGDPPFVVARGGFSGLFPDSSTAAFSLAQMTSVPDLILWCDVQLTKDGVGICFPDVKLSNASDISEIFPNRGNKYLVNGVPTQGYFSVDFTMAELANVFWTVTQGVFSRTNKFDGNMFPVLTVQDVFKQFKPPGFWLNIQHDTFYSQHNASMRSFVISASKSVIISHISSPEVGFLNSIASRFRTGPTKLVFRFLGQNDKEPTTNQTYGSLSKNLTYIKTFASGILVPKSYIWPVNALQYLLPHTSIVLDAHKEGLEVFASEFANDVPFSFNYSYDPVAEYLNFIDNGEFSVDGVLSDFPITPSNAIDCFAHLGKNASVQAKTLVISKNGASGDYPGCTDLAYAKAISDGADIIDCPVQMSQDGIPFCFSSINLIDGSTVAQSTFSNLASTIPEIKSGSGIYTFSLNWSQIQSLTPAIGNPYSDYQLFRNPKNKNAGKFVSLSEFLDMAKNTSSLAGVLINIEYAAYLAEKQGLGVTDAVLDALNKAGYDKGTKRVLIQSTNSSVLMKLKQSSKYERVYVVDDAIRDAQNATIGDIKGFANAVIIEKASVFPLNALFLTGVTDVVSKLQSYNLSVYVETFSNEFVSQAWDFFSDATVEINSFVMGAGVNGVITEFPQTAARYRRNPCLTMGKDTPVYMSPVQPGSLMQLITSQYLPPAEAPNPVLTAADVLEPPLPPVEKIPDSNRSTAVAPTSSDSQQTVAGSILTLFLAAFIASVFLL